MKIKKLFMAVLLCVGFSIYAQEITTKGKGNKEAKSPEKITEARLSKLSTELNLDSKQQEQIKPILAEQTAKMEAMMIKIKANKENGTTLTDAEKKEMKKNRMADKEATDSKMKAIFTPEQFAKYQAMIEAAKEKMKNK